MENVIDAVRKEEWRRRVDSPCAEITAGAPPRLMRPHPRGAGGSSLRGKVANHDLHGGPGARHGGVLEVLLAPRRGVHGRPLG